MKPEALVESFELAENMENILTFSPLLEPEAGSKKQGARWAVGEDGKFALGIEADTGPVAKACAV